MPKRSTNPKKERSKDYLLNPDMEMPESSTQWFILCRNDRNTGFRFKTASDE